jgi:hypothetical protein
MNVLFALGRNCLEHNRLSNVETNNFLIALRQSLNAKMNFVEVVAGPSPEVEQTQGTVEQGDALLKTGGKNTNHCLSGPDLLE